MKQIIKDIITSNTFRFLVRFCDKSIGTILTLHRVKEFESNRLVFNEQLKITPEFLEGLIIALRNEKFSFVSINELSEVLIKKKSVKRLIVFTLDDGYQDNFDNALPIFKSFSVPFTIYISTSFPEKEMIFWWYIIEDIILQNEEVILDSGEKFKCNNKFEKEATFLEIRRRIIKLNPLSFKETLPKIFSKYAFETTKYKDSLPLSWEHIKSLFNESLVTIGGHTHSHISLKFCSTNQIVNEFNYSNALFEKEIGTKPEHFSYPYGDSNTISQNGTNIIAKMGFKTSVTTEVGNIYSHHRNLLFNLPRIAIIEEQQPELIKLLTLMKLKKQ